MRLAPACLRKIRPRAGRLLLGALLLSGCATPDATGPQTGEPGVRGTWTLQGSGGGGQQIFSATLELEQRTGAVAGVLTGNIEMMVSDPRGGSVRTSGCIQPVALQPASATTLIVPLDIGGQATLQLRLLDRARSTRGDVTIVVPGQPPLLFGGVVGSRDDAEPSVLPRCSLRP